MNLKAHLRALLEPVRALEEKATKGPWRAMRFGNAPLANGQLVGQSELEPVSRPHQPRWVGWVNKVNQHRTFLCDEDADLIAALRNLLPQLLALVDAGELAQPDGWVMVPREPSIGRLVSMAIRSDHGLGVPGHYDRISELTAGDFGSQKSRMESAIRSMRQLYEEATGQGFYQPEKEDAYAAMLAATPTPPGADK